MKLENKETLILSVVNLLVLAAVVAYIVLSD
jgi:hypothetical protein